MQARLQARGRKGGGQRKREETCSDALATRSSNTRAFAGNMHAHANLQACAMACSCADEDVAQSSTFQDTSRDTKSSLHFAYSQTLLSVEATDRALDDAVLLTSLAQRKGDRHTLCDLAFA